MNSFNFIVSSTSTCGEKSVRKKWHNLNYVILIIIKYYISYSCTVTPVNLTATATSFDCPSVTLILTVLSPTVKSVSPLSKVNVASPALSSSVAF
ncbi:hypothetical protein [Spiroplasma endosymbiont of Lariophagus distinguendus]|uniref:hypothetical protein n=1 Tax=Spiroplasma endosymbiont of Lariophagus distinguendus TaxID=2935082 RepID=UPI00207AC4F0|nr:hypothetical protein [Spiroplasma endosymbiont of Lariophagus distinguendus]